MKHLFLAILVLFTATSFAQTSAAERDSVANTSAFQLKIKIKTLIAANDLLADPLQPVYVIRYAQLIVTEPSGAGWLTALSYGALTNPVINWDSSESDIQFVINSIFVKYAKAYYRIVD